MKHTFLITLVLILTIYSNAQFAVGGGITYFVSNGTAPSGAALNSDKPGYAAQGVFVYPRYNFNVKDNSSLSIGSPISATLGGLVNSRGGNSTITATFDIPLVLDYNIGLGAKEAQSEDAKTFGGFIGAGFSFTSTSARYFYSKTDGSNAEIPYRSFGPLVHAGIRTNIANRNYFLRGAYKIGLDKLKLNTFFITVGTMF